MHREDLVVTSPCQQDFSGMKPADMKTRFCDACRTHVHDLAAMTKGEAKALLAGDTAEGLCIRYLYDEHGTVVFADDPRLVRPSALMRAKRLATGALALALPLSLTACMGAKQYDRPPPPPVALSPDTAIVPIADAGSTPVVAPAVTDAGAPNADAAAR